jgi:hypothetical protein
MRQLERLDYRIRRPRDTHTRPATCDEVGCEMQRDGWISAIDERTLDGQRQAHYIRSVSGRGFTEERGPDGLTRFHFPPGQQCFAQHRVDLQREPNFFRVGTHSTVRRHTAETWVDDQATELDRLATFVERHG